MAESSQPRMNYLFWKSKNLPTERPINFSDVYTRYNQTIYRYILARVGHVDDAHDITAHVFLKAYRNLSSYRLEVPIIAWLMGITRHQIVDYYRVQRDEISLSAIPELPTFDLAIEESIAHKQRLQRVTEALNALSEERREAIAMRLFAGLKNPEIADIMGKTTEAVAMLVHRGIQDLRKRLSEED